MTAILDRMGHQLLDTAVEGLLWTSLICVALLLCRRPARRVMIARVGLIGVLLLWPASALLPSSLHPLDRWLPRLLGGGPSSFDFLLHGALPRWLAVAYLAGLSLGVAWLGLGAVACRVLLRGAQPPSPATAAVFADLTRSFPRPPRLAISDRLQRPVLLGCLQPTILLPVRWEESATPTRLRLGLLHELAHFRHRDFFFRTLGRLTLAFWFFTPGLRWAFRRLQQDQEILADLHAARRFGASASYASVLLELARSHHTRLSDQFRPAALAGSNALEERLSTLLVETAYREESAPFWWRTVGHTIGVAGFVVVSGVNLVESRLDRPATPAPLRESFRLSVVDAESSPDAPARLELPVALPDRFEITARVFQDSAGPGELTIAGVHPHGLWPAGGWLPVEVRRESTGTVVLLDGRPVPFSAGHARARWLTLEAGAGRPLRVRDLEMRY